MKITIQQFYWKQETYNNKIKIVIEQLNVDNKSLLWLVVKKICVCVFFVFFLIKVSWIVLYTLMLINVYIPSVYRKYDLSVHYCSVDFIITIGNDLYNMWDIIKRVLCKKSSQLPIFATLPSTSKKCRIIIWSQK